MEYFWVVPIIAIAVWILSNLIRPEEPVRRGPQRPRRPFSDEPSRPRSEVDRFLDEINNLRKKAEEERPVEAQPVSAEPIPPEPRPEPVVLPRPMPRPRSPRIVRPTMIPPVPAGVPESVRPIKAPKVMVEILDVVPVTPPAAAPAPMVILPPVSEPVSPAVASLRAMFKSPQSLRTAVLLQTVLGPPRCRKRRP